MFNSRKFLAMDIEAPNPTPEEFKKWFGKKGYLDQLTPTNTRAASSNFDDMAGTLRSAYGKLKTVSMSEYHREGSEVFKNLSEKDKISAKFLVENVDVIKKELEEFNKSIEDALGDYRDKITKAEFMKKDDLYLGIQGAAGVNTIAHSLWGLIYLAGFGAAVSPVIPLFAAFFGVGLCAGVGIAAFFLGMLTVSKYKLEKFINESFVGNTYEEKRKIYEELKKKFKPFRTKYNEIAENMKHFRNKAKELHIEPQQISASGTKNLKSSLMNKLYGLLKYKPKPKLQGTSEWLDKYDADSLNKFLEICKKEGKNYCDHKEEKIKQKRSALQAKKKKTNLEESLREEKILNIDERARKKFAELIQQIKPAPQEPETPKK